MANKVALILAWNSPIYPLYLLALIGREALPWGLLTALVTPFFYVIPWLARRSSLLGRLALPVVGAANTIWCIKLFGADSGVGVFLYPCIMLAALLFRRSERWLMLPLLGALLALWFVPPAALGAPVLSLSPEAGQRLVALNTVSVAALLALFVLQFADIFRASGPGATL